MYLIEQNLEYVLESVIEALQNEEIEIDEELLDECLEEVLSEISTGLASKYLKRSREDRDYHDVKANRAFQDAEYYGRKARYSKDLDVHDKYRKQEASSYDKASSHASAHERRTKGISLAKRKLTGFAKVNSKD